MRLTFTSLLTVLQFSTVSEHVLRIASSCHQVISNTAVFTQLVLLIRLLSTPNLPKQRASSHTEKCSNIILYSLPLFVGI